MEPKRVHGCFLHVPVAFKPGVEHFGERRMPLRKFRRCLRVTDMAFHAQGYTVSGMGKAQNPPNGGFCSVVIEVWGRAHQYIIPDRVIISELQR